MGRHSKALKDAIFDKDLTDHKSKEYDQLDFRSLYNPGTLNIFSDASGFADGKASYGIICVCMDTIVQMNTFCLENSNNYEAEALGIRLKEDFYKEDGSYLLQCITLECLVRLMYLQTL